MNPSEDKNTLLEDSEAEKPSGLPSAANVFSVSAAIRMHSGDVEVPGMICGMTDKVEKMIKKVFFECGKCGTINEVHSYHRPRFAYEVPAKPSRPLECVKCGETSGHEYDNTFVNALLIELQNSDAFSDLERLSVILFDDDTNNVSTGEQVILTGSIQKIRKNGLFCLLVR
jgi:DNA replicative helicase MCM subunit Mcm2 (Cdc46/Mcm family)